jgi:hypothetical protein
MDPDLIVTLLVLALINIQSFYFGFYRQPRTGAWLQQSSFVVLTFFLIPFLIYVLYLQSTSIDALENHGIKKHPAIKNAVGIGNGRGENPSWVFALHSNEDNVLEFYKSPNISTGWELIEENYLFSRYVSEDKQLTIAHKTSYDKETLIFTISDRL